MYFIKQFCLSCSAFCTLYRDINVPSVDSLEDDKYILLEELYKYPEDKSEESFEQQEYKNHRTDNQTDHILYAMAMLSKCGSDRIL
jgi:hypothetical protein